MTWRWLGQVRFDPTREPALVTVSGVAGDLPSPLVLNPGRWMVNIQNEVEGLKLVSEVTAALREHADRWKPEPA